jgi:ribose-phosphate pyrophosphokinase
MCIKDYVDTKWGNLPCILEMPYIPYSRMDRQEEKRLFTLKTFANLINSMNFTYVKVMEPHSEVSVALIDRVKVENKSADLALKAMRDILGLQGSCWLQDSLYGDIHMNKADMFKQAREAGIYFVYPDAGAEKRYRKQIKYDKVLTCSKDRDFNTGRINSIEINGADKIDDCKIAIIIDDLSSRGGTFIGSAQALRKAFPNIEEIVLCVTHCENTIYEGEVLTGTDITKVFTTNSILRVPAYNEVTDFDKNKLIIENIR